MSATSDQIKEPSKFELLIKRHELKDPVPKQLYQVLSTCNVVLLCDDSSSMSNLISEEGNDPFAQKKSTRWMELKKLAAVIIEFITATNPKGLDIYFLNRPSVLGVKDMTGLQTVFSDLPNGKTPLNGALKKVYNKYKDSLDDKQLLIVCVTDGEPTDCSRNELFNTLVQITQGGNVHVSFVECTDNEEDMEYLDRWDGRIKNFDNTDDYREELRKVKNTKGQNFKFDYTDYVIKILLATFIRWYFNLDQSNNTINNNNCNCCTVL